MAHAGSPLKFWAEAVAHAADEPNRCLCPRDSTKTSYQLMTGSIPRVYHLRIFSSRAWTHVPNQKRTKREEKVKECVIIGCFDNSQYKVWLHETKQPILSRHVNILENTFSPMDWYQVNSGDEIFESDSDTIPARPLSRSPPRQMNQIVNAEVNLLQNNETGHTPLDRDISEITYIPGYETEADVHDREMDISPQLLTSSNPPTSENNQDGEDSDNNAAQVEDASRYPTRISREPQRFDPSYANIAIEGGVPQTVSEALDSVESIHWGDAISSELKSLQQNNTWREETLTHDVAPLETRFVFNRKQKSDGKVGLFKARLVVKGFMQGQVDGTYSPVVDFSTVRLALAIAVEQNLLVHQMDVRTAFLNGEIDSDVYILPPVDSRISLAPGKALKLRKGLYGLKQAPRLWMDKWKSVVYRHGFYSLKADSCVFR